MAIGLPSEQSVEDDGKCMRAISAESNAGMAIVNKMAVSSSTVSSADV